MNIAGLASNRGRNLRTVADRAPGGAELSVVLSDHDDAPILEAARSRGIPTASVVRGSDESKEAHEARLLDALGGYDVELLCLDGYMRILSGSFLDAVPTTLNVHPSLLPAFPGMNAHEQALEAGVRVSGCTVHVATETVDSGPIITQESVPVYEDDTPDTLKHRVLTEAEFAAYPRAIRWFANDRVERREDGIRIDGDESGEFPARRLQSQARETTLRYGENPHQEAAVYADPSCPEANVVAADQLNEGAKALSYNNYNDADGALELIKEFEDPAAAVIKHTNPAGAAVGDTLADAYDRALATDPMSAFGGIVALNRECDGETATAIIDSFKEVVVAPGYSDGALDVLTEKPNLRILEVGSLETESEPLSEQPIVGGSLVQERDRKQLSRDELEVVTDREPTDAQFDSMLFAWDVIKHVKSNAIVFADGLETVGIGMGQVSRVDAVRLASMKAEEHAEGKSAAGAVMASDAFFPFPDGLRAGAEAGIEAVIQPGGSKNDDQVIEAANEDDLAMVLTGTRAFRHD